MLGGVLGIRTNDFRPPRDPLAKIPSWRQCNRAFKVMAYAGQTNKTSPGGRSMSTSWYQGVAHMYEQTTRGIRVKVDPHYLEDESSPEDSRFVWAYTVRIENGSEDVVRLRGRRWLITDALGLTEEVVGDGVVGEQPVIRPGEGFEYTSGAPLGTPSGMMVGQYEMETSGGETFDVEIPAFSLDSPHEYRQIH